MPVLGVIAVLALLVGAVAGGRAIGGRSLVDTLLAAFVIAYVELIAVGLGLSVGSRLTLHWLTPVMVAVAIAAVAVNRRVRPTAVAWRPAARAAHDILAEDRLLLVLAVVTGVVLAYTLAIALFTPPAEGDALSYHLARAAYWVQQHRVGAVPGNTDERIDGSPPGAELALAFTMLVSHSLRLVGLVQFFSLLAAILASFGLARRIGVDRRGAAYGALLLPTSAVILMQAPTALNDLVVGALAAVAVYFSLGTRRIDVVLAAATIGALALTKVTAAVAVPGIVLIALVGRSRSRWAVVAASAVVVAPGLLWLRFGPVTQSSEPTVGGVASRWLDSPWEHILERFAHIWLLANQTIEIPGAFGADVLIYGVAAAVIAVVAIAGDSGQRRVRLIAAALIAATMALVPFAELAARGYRKTWAMTGQHRLELLDVARRVNRVDTAYTWYGPTALVLACVALVVAVRQLRRRAVAPVAVALAAAPFVWIVALALIATYFPTSGRYVMGAVILSSATWGLAVAWRPLAWWAVATAAAGVVLVLVHFEERPAGIRLFEGEAPPSVWTRSAADALGFERGSQQILEFASASIPLHARLALTTDLMATPFFGPRLTRTVLPAETVADADRLDVDWAILPRASAPRCRPGWKRYIGFSRDFVALKRDPTEAC